MLNISCEDPLDSVVTKKDKNDLFELTLESSNQIVTSKGSLDIMAKVERLQAGIADVSNKVLGVWDLIYSEPDTLNPQTLEVNFTFSGDKTVTRKETYRFAEVFSKIVGKWNVSSIAEDTISSKILQIEYEFDDDTTVTIEETHKFDVSKLGSRVLGEWEVTESKVGGSALDISGKTLKYAFKNDSSVTFEKTEPTSSGTNIGYSSIPVFVDIDKDADADLFLGVLDGTVGYFENVGTTINPVFSQKTGSSNPLNNVVVSGAAAPAFADFDSDGDMDVFIGQEDGTISYFKNIGTSTSPSFSEQTGANNPFENIRDGYNSIPTFADINDDGDMDAFIGRFDGKVYYYENDNGTLSLQANDADIAKLVVDANAAPAFVDLDKDGDLDAFIGAGDGTIKHFTNTGNSTGHSFSEEQTGENNPLGVVDIGSNAVLNYQDIDSDGDIDLFIGEYDGNTNYYKNNGSAKLPNFVLQTENYGAHITTTRSGGWSYTHSSNNLKVAYYDTIGGSEELGELDFDTDSLKTPINSFMYWSTNKRQLTLKKIAHVTEFSVPSDSVVSKSGGWEYNKDSNSLSVTVYGNNESGAITFDTKSSTVPIGAFMYWESNTRGAVTFVKTSNVSGAEQTPDSVITVAGGWAWNPVNGNLSATIAGKQLTGTVSFETLGPLVPIDGFMYWNTDQEGSLIFKKKSNVSGSGSSSMKLALDATGGTLDIHHVSSSSNISVALPDSAKSKFQVEGLFIPKSGKNSALISAKFQDLFVKIPITIVDR
tara:strand:+ start:1609 stop:3906 length:2298 start_codon:yes stop_codon:yes gene_type:complete